MKKYEISKIGGFHLNYNEDSSAFAEIGENKIIVAVMDGCSMGTESHFASTLIAKLLRKIGKEISFRNFAEKRTQQTKDCLKEVLGMLFKDLQDVKNKLHLEREELLSTIILGILDTKDKEVELIAVGDGLICCNGQLYEYEQDNKPDYLGYHLDKNFEQWFQNQSQTLNFKNVQDLSICTDGIFTFKNFDGKAYEQMSEKKILDYLLIDDKGAQEENMLKKKILELEQNFGLLPSDDLTIIRVTTE